ncbi:uncharacterized protein LOC131430904 [Malaya genurostris]|uniref:uncharacterized protein LOC131430904 n=1 Tax=Malaya genurostris TaxID=325434 RepID=UPI0026F3B301|nr:uncharacterized protein LOC131430904 [Malaya genurostris]
MYVCSLRSSSVENMAPIYVLLVLAAFCTSFTEAGFLDWFRSSANKGHRICKVDFEVLDPKGLRLWTAHKPEMKMFGVELYINPTGKSDQSTCNLCKNTTEVMHGKFFIQDDNVIVKKGDVLEYVAITDNGNTVQRHKPKKLVVNDYLIKPQGRCACPAPVQYSSVHESEPSGEIELLERIISHLSNRCAAGVVSNYLFLQVGSPAGPSDLVQRVKSYLTDNVLLKPYADAVTSAEEYADGIGFQMKSVVDKLKILELGNGAGDILDYDGFTTIDKVDIRVSE